MAPSSASVVNLRRGCDRAPSLSLPRLLAGVAAVIVVALWSPVVHAVAEDPLRLENGVIRGPVLHEHSFGRPLVSNWWSEGVPHYMIGGSALATTSFLRLTPSLHNKDGFAFNMVPCDHDGWEVKLRFSVKAPLPVVQQMAAEGKSAVGYRGGEGLALWYLERPLGDDHQHVPKYSKPIDIETELNKEEEEYELAEDTYEDDDDDMSEDELKLRRQRREAATRSLLFRMEKSKRDERRKRKLAAIKRLQGNYERGKSTQEDDDDDDDDGVEVEPRVMGLKFSDLKGLGILLDSHGDDNEGLTTGPSVSVLLNVPRIDVSDGGAVERNDTASPSGPSGGSKYSSMHNNFDPRLVDFRSNRQVLKCSYDFRQQRAHVHYKAGHERTYEIDNEEPVELVVRYYQRKLTVILVREDAQRRVIMSRAQAEAQFQSEEVRQFTPVSVRSAGAAGGSAADEMLIVKRVYVETMCGELMNVDLPLYYFFGVSASTGHEELTPNDMIDTHDVYSLEMRELGTNARELGYSRSVPIAHFDHDRDQKERVHFSRALPVEPEA